MTLAWWHIGCLLMGVVQAAYLLVNQHFKTPERILMLWRGFGALALFLPLSLFVGGWPRQTGFYLAALGACLVISVLDRLLFRASARYGAGATSRLIALNIPIAFVMWSVIKPGHLETLFSKPHSLLILPALAGLVASVIFLKRDIPSRKVLVALVPVYFLGAAHSTFIKLAMEQAHDFGALLTYGSLSGFTTSLVTLLWQDKTALPLRTTDVFAKRTVQSGLSIVCLLFFFILLRTSTLASAPNPAFVTALAMLSPLWVLGWNKIHHVPDETNLWAGLGCVASALLLVLATI